MAGPPVDHAVPRITRLFYIDVRSLALGRIALSLVLLSDLALRTRDLEAHYSDAGVLPRAALHLRNWDFLWSLHALFGSTWYQGALFAVASLFGIGLLLGYRTFASTLGSWLLLISLHGRNPLLRDGQDDLLRVMLFWCLFLPLGVQCSLDARRARRAHPLRSPETVAISPGSVCLILQICLVYWAGAIAKLQSPWWMQKDAVFLTLSIGRYETHLGQFLLHFPGLLKAITLGVVAVELLGPLLLFIPRSNDIFRMLAIGLFVLLHLGFAVCLKLGIFPFVGMAIWLFLLPSNFWNRFERRNALSSGRAPRRWNPLFNALAVVVFILVLLYNIQYLTQGRIPRWVGTLCEALGIQQYWVLFSPRREMVSSAMIDGWFVVRGVFADGEEADLRGVPLSWERPPLISSTFKNRRWRHYLANLSIDWPRGSAQRDTVEQSRVAYAQWLCREWNRHHPVEQRASWVSVYFMRYRLGTREAASPRLLAQAVCTDSDVTRPPTLDQPRDR